MLLGARVARLIASSNIVLGSVNAMLDDTSIEPVEEIVARCGFAFG
jgi:hypothetical protein